MKSKSKSFFTHDFFHSYRSRARTYFGEDDTVFEEAQVIFEKIKESSIDIILSRVPGLQMKHCLHC